MSAAHTLLIFVLSFVCGFGLAWLARPGRWYQHVAAMVSAVSLSIGLAYAGFLIVIGVTTGSWPQFITIAGLAYALAWFTIPATFTIGPAAAMGYFCGLLAGGCSSRGPLGSARGERHGKATSTT